MNLENTKDQMKKDVLELCILSILSKRDYDASDIIKALQKAKMIVVDGTHYPFLTRQNHAGFLN